MTVVTLVRHGRTPWHSPTRYAGDSDVPLDEVGVAQAAALGAWAAGRGFTSLVCSDLRRAVDTAGAVAATTGLVPHVDPRLREPHFGVAEGRTVDEVRAAEPEAAARFDADPATHHWPGAEPPAEVAARGVAALRDAVARDPDGAPLLVAHSTLLRLVLCATLGIPLSEYRRVLPRLDPATVTEVAVGERVGLLRYNAPFEGLT
jgi:probable phosphoglycerate mutase